MSDEHKPGCPLSHVEPDYSSCGCFVPLTAEPGISERLRALANEWFEMCGDIHIPLNQAADTIESQSAEIARLKARLEIDPEWDSEDADGIACRNDTIAILDGKIAAANARIEQLTDHISEQITHAETRIQDGGKMGASIWRIALEDIVRENRAILSDQPQTQGEG